MAMATVERRTVLKGVTALGAGAAAAPLLAACGGGSSGGSTPAADSAPAAAESSTTSTPAAGSSSAAAPNGISVAKAKIPVGGGVIDKSVVVTQPTAGAYKAFSSTCTHEQCTVGSVEGGFIVCPCHGSMYAIATGVPTASSPAKKPLPAKTITPSGDNLVIS
jgi:Rieske Fe-S protein